MTKRLHHGHGGRVDRAARALLLALILAGCGGGVDSGGTGSPTFASGTITGFGSVIVGGVHFDDSQATVTDADGTSRSRDDLRLGMTTEIRGTALATDATGTVVSTASSIAFGSDIVGPITRIDVAAGQLVVLGQTVDVVSTTVFDDASVSGGLAALRVGDIAEVYALFDIANGHYTATRIERRNVVVTYALRGVVSLLDTTAKAFSIGSERISYAVFAGALPATLANGSIVRVRLRIAQIAGVWLVSALNDGVQRPQDQDVVRLEGRVTAFTSAARFSVSGVPVDASALVATPGLALGARVEVEGTARAGVLVASAVKVRTDGDVAGQNFELRGFVTAPDAASLSFVLRGVTIVYSAATEFKNGTPAGLTAGVIVEARGQLSPDGTRLVASRITFR
jgi:Domain of unknown function (DUF5666)